MSRALVLIGTLPVGDTCARRAGLLALAKKKSGLVFPAVRYKSARQPGPQTVDMFPELQP